VQEPPAGRVLVAPAALAKHPQARSRGVAGDVVVARDVLAVPPARFDAFGAFLELERALVAGPVAAVERLRLRQQPQRS